MNAARAWPWLLLPVAITWGLLAEREQVAAGRSWGFVLADLVGGLVLVLVGLSIWRRRPSNRCWWLVVGAGFAWYVGALHASPSVDVGQVGFVFRQWYDVLLVWALLAYPTGRVRLRRDQVLLAAVVTLFAVRTASRLLLWVPPDVTGCDCVSNRFTPVTDPGWWRQVEDLFAWGFATAMLLVVASTAARWHAAGHAGRRMMSPALVAAGILAAAVWYEAVAGWNAGITELQLRAFSVVAWAHAAVAVAFSFGFVQLGRTRSALAGLVAELGDDEPPARLGDALARALDDPDLALYPWSAARGAYVDDLGAPVPLPTDNARAVTRIERHGEPVAALVHDVALLEDPGLVAGIVAAVRLTSDNEQLQAEIERQLDEVAASRTRIVAAGDAERRRIERNLHDGAQQQLVTIALGLRLAESRLGDDADPDARLALRQAIKGLGQAIEELRDLARGIHPAILSEAGLGAALESLAERSPVPVRLEVALPSEPPADVAATAYFTAAEALANVAKHATATRVTLRAVAGGGRLRLEVVDDGVGGARADGGSGLRGIADRVAAAGGSLSVVSPPGAGTRVEAVLPCAWS